jgi:hypothetical protein
MNKVATFTYPELLVYEDGRVFNTLTNRFSERTFGGTCAIDGPVIYHITASGHSRYLGVKTLVYEAFVKKAKYRNGELVESIDGDPDNVHFTNLRKRVRKGAFSEMREFEKVYGWNGDEEIYC